jgi:glycerol uptake facilitator-like aquaporin
MLISVGRKLLSEALGTCLLLALVVGSGIMGETLSGGNVAIALLANSLATGAGLVVLITVFGPVSGAHFNPVVTLVFALKREIGPLLTLAYIAMQVIGASLGVWLAHAMFGLEIIQVSTHLRDGTGLWIAEGVATFGLILTILGTLKQRPDFIPSAVGLYITAAYWFTASTAFANPAVTLARSLTNTFCGIAPSSVTGFIGAQVLGAILGLLTAWLLGLYSLKGIRS